MTHGAGEGEGGELTLGPEHETDLSKLTGADVPFEALSGPARAIVGAAPPSEQAFADAALTPTGSTLCHEDAHGQPMRNVLEFVMERERSDPYRDNSLLPAPFLRGLERRDLRHLSEQMINPISSEASRHMHDGFERLMRDMRARDERGDIGFVARAVPTSQPPAVEVVRDLRHDARTFERVKRVFTLGGWAEGLDQAAAGVMDPMMERALWYRENTDNPLGRGFNSALIGQIRETAAKWLVADHDRLTRADCYPHMNEMVRLGENLKERVAPADGQEPRLELVAGGQENLLDTASMG